MPSRTLRQDWAERAAEGAPDVGFLPDYVLAEANVAERFEALDDAPAPAPAPVEEEPVVEEELVVDDEPVIEDDTFEEPPP